MDKVKQELLTPSAESRQDWRGENHQLFSNYSYRRLGRHDPHFLNE